MTKMFFSEWKLIPNNAKIQPNIASWRKSDLSDLITDYECKGRLILEDTTVIDCIIGYVILDDGEDERVLPKVYKE